MRLTALLLSVALVCSARPAFAEESADARFDRATELAKKGKFAEAEALFESVLAERPTYEVFANLGFTEAELKKWDEAADHLRSAVRTFPLAGKPEKKKALEGVYAEAVAKVARLRVDVQAGAEIALDGKPLGRAPLAGEVYVLPGAHRVSARSADGARGEVSFDAKAGGESPVKVDLTKPDDAVSPNVRVPLIVTGTVLTLTTLGVGIGLFAASSDKHAQVVQLGTMVPAGSCTPTSGGVCADLRAAGSERDALGNASTGLFVSAALLGVATAIGGALAPAGAKKSASVRVLPAGLGFAIDGRW